MLKCTSPKCALIGDSQPLCTYPDTTIGLKYIFISPTYLSIIFLHCQPFVRDKDEFFLSLDISHHHIVEEPGPKLTTTRVVMPHTHEVQVSQGPEVENVFSEF